MRIVGGEWRGRQLADIGDGDISSHLRPTSDRFRETVFNILRAEKYGFAPKNMRVLDLFSGTGALSFEALSRGARFAVMVDQGVRSSKLIRENIHILDCQNQTKLLKRSALKLGPCEFEPFQLVFLDPPYAKSLGEAAIKSALDGGWLDHNSVVVWEDEVAPLVPNQLRIEDQRQVGRALLTIAKFSNE